MRFAHLGLEIHVERRITMDVLANLRELSPHFENPWIQSLGIFILSLALAVIIRWSLRLVLLALVKKNQDRGG